MHGPMLEPTTAALRLHPTIKATLRQSACLASTMTAMATIRGYAYPAIGALGGVELTSPARLGRVGAGLWRCSLEPRARKSFELRANLDIAHSQTWKAERLAPLVAEETRRAQGIAEGALMRLICEVKNSASRLAGRAIGPTPIRSPAPRRRRARTGPFAGRGRPAEGASWKAQALRAPPVGWCACRSCQTRCGAADLG